MLVAGSVAGCWGGKRQALSALRRAALAIAIPPFVRSCTWVLGRARGGATAARTKRNSKTERRRSKTRSSHKSQYVNDERPRPPSKEPIGILYIILFRFAFSRAVSGLQATEGLSRGSLALGEPEAEATNGTADGPGTQRLPPLTPLVRIQITEAAHNAEGTSQRAHGSPCTPARTLRGNARTTHANWIFFRIQNADDA